MMVMGFENMVAKDRMALVGIAQMAHGSGWFEGTRGGRGHMGLIKTADGRERVIKFDTHGGTSRDRAAAMSSDNLRRKLWDIANGAGNNLSDAVRNEIRTKLGLSADGTPPRFKSLLDRKVVAQVLTLIGGKELWNAALSTGDASIFATDENKVSNYRSSIGTNIDAGSLQSAKECHNQHLEAFFESASQLGDAADRYVKLVPSRNGNGIALADAGRRNILRDADDKADNDRVHQFFARAIRAHFDGKIPKCVQELMTGFTGGHPLSAKRIGLIRDAIRFVDSLGGGFPMGLTLSRVNEILTSCGLTREGFDGAIDACAAGFNLTDKQKAIVKRTTITYLLSRSESLSNGLALQKLVRVGNRRGVAPIGNIADEISAGRLDGTRIGLFQCGIYKGTDEAPNTTECLLSSTGGGFISRLSEDDGEYLAWVEGQFVQVKSNKGSGERMAPSVVSALLEKKSELLQYAQEHGSVGMNGLYRVLLGRNPRAQRAGEPPVNYRHALQVELTDEIHNKAVRDHLPREIDDGTFSAFSDVVEPAMMMTGLGISDAYDVWINGWKNEFGCLDFESEYKEYTIDQCLGQIALDTGGGRSDSMVSFGENVTIRKEANQSPQAYATAVRDRMVECLSAKGPVQNRQLVAALQCCAQTMDKPLTLFRTKAQGARSFRMDDDGILHYEQQFTACGKPHLFHCEISPDGRVKMTDFRNLAQNPVGRQNVRANEAHPPVQEPVRADRPLYVEQNDLPALDAVLGELSPANAFAVLDEFRTFAWANPKDYVKVFDRSGIGNGKVALGLTQGEEAWELGGRDPASSAVNDEARKILLAAVKKLFPDGNIPASVRREMTHFGDFNGGGLDGRPLSADRIRRIFEAIDATVDNLRTGETRQMVNVLRQRGPSFTAANWANVAQRLAVLSGRVHDEDLEKAVRLNALGEKIRGFGLSLNAVKDVPAATLDANGRKALKRLVADLEDITAELPDAIVGGDADIVWEEAMALRTELAWFADEVSRMPAGGERPGAPVGLGDMKIADFLGREPDSLAVCAIAQRIDDVQTFLAGLEGADAAGANERLDMVGSSRARVDALRTTLERARTKLPPRILSMLEAQSARALNLLDALETAVRQDATDNTAFVSELRDKAGGFGKLVRDVIDGKYDAETYRTLRKLGYEDWAIEYEFSSRTESYGKTLGSGNSNTVYDKTGGGIVGEGRRWVFKDGAEANANLGSYVQFMGCGKNMAANNLANGLAQDLLGVDVVVKTKLTAPQKAGDPPSILMEFAGGKSLTETAKLVREADDAAENMDFGSPKGCHDVMEKLGCLDWFDWMTGQGDRHFKNCNIGVEGEGENQLVSVKAFDNDASFPTLRTGLTTGVCRKDELQCILNNMTLVEARLKKAGKLKPEEKLLDSFACVRTGDDQYTFKIGFDKDGNRWSGPVARGLNEVLGINNARKPSYIPRAVLTKLEGLRGVVAQWKQSQQLPESFGILELDRLKKTLSLGQFSAMMSRLDEMIAYAGELKKQGLVLEDLKSEGGADNLTKIYGKMVDNAWIASKGCGDQDGSNLQRSVVVDSAAEFLSECFAGGIGLVQQNLNSVANLMDRPLFRRLVSCPAGQELVGRVIENVRRPDVRAAVMDQLLLLVARLDGKAAGEAPDGVVVDRIVRFLNESDDDLLGELLNARNIDHVEFAGDEEGAKAEIGKNVEVVMKKWEDLYVQKTVQQGCETYHLDFTALFGNVPVRSDFMRAVSAMLTNPDGALMRQKDSFGAADWQDRFNLLGALFDRTKVSDPPQSGDQLLAKIPPEIADLFCEEIPAMRSLFGSGPLTLPQIAKTVWRREMLIGIDAPLSDNEIQALSPAEFIAVLTDDQRLRTPMKSSIRFAVSKQLGGVLKELNGIFVPSGVQKWIKNIADHISANSLQSIPGDRCSRDWKVVKRYIDGLESVIKGSRTMFDGAMSSAYGGNDLFRRRLEGVFEEMIKKAMTDLGNAKAEAFDSKTVLDDVKVKIENACADWKKFEALSTMGYPRVLVDKIEKEFVSKKFLIRELIAAPCAKSCATGDNGALIGEAIALFGGFRRGDIPLARFLRELTQFTQKAFGKMLVKIVDESSGPGMSRDDLVKAWSSADSRRNAIRFLFTALRAFDETKTLDRLMSECQDRFRETIGALNEDPDLDEGTQVAQEVRNYLDGMREADEGDDAPQDESVGTAPHFKPIRSNEIASLLLWALEMNDSRVHA